MRLLSGSVCAAALAIGAWTAAARQQVPALAVESAAPRPRLHLRTTDSAGRPIEVEAVSAELSWVAAFPQKSPARWPDQFVPIVVPDRSAAHSLAWFGQHLAGTRVGPGEIVFDVEAGHRYRVGVIGPSEAWRPIQVDVPHGAIRADVTVVALADAGFGTLEVTPVDADGDAITTGIGVRIEQVQEGAPLLVDSFADEPGLPRTFSLPTGRYRVAIEGRPALDGWHGRLWSPSAYGRSKAEVEVVSGRTTQARVRVDTGARLHLKLRGDVLEEDRRAFTPRQDVAYIESISALAAKAAISLTTDGHWPHAVPFTYVMTGNSSSGTHVGPWLAIGSEQVSQLLPVGRFRLEAHMPGGRTASADVVLVDGDTTTVTLSFP